MSQRSGPSGGVSAGAVAAAAIAAYAVVALVRPQPVATAMARDAAEHRVWLRAARVLAVRDLVVTGGALASRDERVLRAGLVARVAFDVADAVVLGRAAPTPQVRATILAVTGASAALTIGALLRDRRRA